MTKRTIDRGRKPAALLRAADILAQRETYQQRLNPKSRLRGCALSGKAGLGRTGISIAWLPPGKESFAYHAHRYEEEWIYVLEGRGISEVDGVETEVGRGDFLAFPTPSVPHLLKNPFAEELVYLMGGENRPGVEVIDYPRLGKTYALVSESGRTAFYELGEPEYPFGPADDE